MIRIRNQEDILFPSTLPSSQYSNNFVSAQPGNSRPSVSSRRQEPVEMTPQQSQSQDEPAQDEPATLPAHVNLILSKFMNQGTSRHHHHPQTSLRKRKFRGYHDNPRDNCVDFFDVTVTKCSVGKEALRQLDIHPSTIMRNASGSERQPLTTTNTLDCPHLKAALFGNANGTSDVPPQSRQYSYKADSVGVTCDPTASDYSQYAYDCPEWSQNANTRVPNHVQVPPDRLHTGQAVRRTGTPELQMTVSSLSNSPTTTEEDPLDLSRKKRPGHEIWSDNGQVSEKTTPESDSNNIQFINNGEERKDDNTQPQHVPDAVFVSEPYMHANTENTLPAVDLSRNNFKPSNKGLQRLRDESSNKPIQHHGSKTSGQRSHPSALSFATLVGNQHPNERDANIKAGCPPQQGIHGPKQGSVLPGYPGNPYQSSGWRQPAGLHVRPPPGLLIQAHSNPKPSNGSHPEVAMQLQGSYAYGQHPNIPYGHPINQQVPNQAYPPDRFQPTSPYVRGRAPNSYPSASPVYYPHNTTALSSSVQPRPMWSNPHYAEAPSKPFDKPLQSGPRPLQEQHALMVSVFVVTAVGAFSKAGTTCSTRSGTGSARSTVAVPTTARGFPYHTTIASAAAYGTTTAIVSDAVIVFDDTKYIGNTFTNPIHDAEKFSTRVHNAKTAFGRTNDYVTSTTVIIFSTIRWTTVTIQSIAVTLFGTIITIVSTTVTITGTTVTIIYGTVHHRLHGTVTIIQTTDTIISTTVTNQSIAVTVICTINTIVSTKATITWTTVTIIYGTVHGTVTIIQTTVTIICSTATIIHTTVVIIHATVTIIHSTVTIIQTTVTIIHGTVTIIHGTVTIIHATVTIASTTVTITQTTVTIIQTTVTIIQTTVTIIHTTVTIIRTTVTITHSTVTIIRTTVTIICGTVTIASTTVTITHSTVTIIRTTVTIICGTVTIASITVTITHSTVTIIHGTVTIIHSTVTITHATVTIIHGTVTIIHSTVTIIHTTVTIIHTTVTIIHATVTIIHGTVTIIHSDSADSKAAEMPLLLAFLNSAPVHKATKSATPKQVPQDKHQQSPPSGNKPQGSSSGVINDIEELRSLLLEENAEDGEEFPTSRQSRDVGPCNYKNPQLAYYWDCLQTTLPSPFDKNPAYDRWNTYNGWHTYNTYTGMREPRGPTKRRQAGHQADNMMLKKRQMRGCLDQLENKHMRESTDTDGGNSRHADALNRVNGWRAREPVLMAMPRQGMEAVISPRELTSSLDLQPLEGPALLMANRIRLVQEKPLRPPPPLIKIRQT
ncbi:hypothetical protein Bbelb_088640 [Branchiostoma belcheri]|nr:hypothetical protein Bbelb_088640 [Branchiostoma belcheri]